jgi:CheY-like chemotaxis protein
MNETQEKWSDVLYGRSPKILIVDDEDDQRDLLLHLLADEHLDATGVGTGADAISLCAQTDFDLCIIDGRLPDMLGTRLIGEIKLLTPTVSCILLTGFPEEFAAEVAVNCGADGFLSKPINPEFLVSLIEGVLFRRLLIRERERFEGVLQTMRTFRHEIGNPLQGLLGNVDLLLRRIPPDPNLDRYVENIHESANRIVELMNRLDQLKRLATRESPVGPMIDLNPPPNGDTSVTPPIEGEGALTENKNPR